MYKDLAWNNFLKTGNIESFLEYKRFLEVNDNLSVCSMQSKDEKENQNVGELLNEIDKSKGDSN